MKHAAAALLFVVAAVVMTWPLGRLMDRAVSDPGDPFINIWILDWGHHATFHDPGSLFHANAFHPAQYSLAFSENLYGIVLFLIPFRLAGAGPITAYNVAMLAGFALSGFGAYLLGWRLTGSRAAGLAAGVFYAFVPFRFTQLSHLQHVWGGWMPLLLAALLAYVDRPSWRRGAVFGAVYLLNALTNIHAFFFGSFATGLSAALFYASGVRRWKEIAFCTAAALILFAPFLYPYAAAADLYQMTRSWEETKRYSAQIGDWLVSPPHSRFYAGLADAAIDPERWLFPGLLSIAAGGAALFGVRRYTRGVVLGVLWIAIGVAGSLGLNFVFHEFLFDAMPGFKAIRAPARWATVTYVGLAMLIAVATAMAGRWRRWLALPVAAMLFAELFVAPIRWYLAIPDAPAVYRWLAEPGAASAIVELPIHHSESEYRYLLRATEHRKPIVNGVSGFTPPLTVRLTEMSKSDPIPDVFTDELREIGCDVVVVHADTLGEYSKPTRDWLRRELARDRLHFVRRFDSALNGDWVFRLGPGPVVRSEQLETFLDGGWTRNEGTFGFLEPPPAVIRDGATFSGFAFSPHGIAAVELLFQNGGIRQPAELREDRRLTGAMPWYPTTPKPRFVAQIPRRPDGVRRKTDVQVEITDGRGGKKRLENLWFEWE